MDDYIIIAACKDDCTKNLTWNSRKWFTDLGSRQVEKIQYRCSFAFIGIIGKKEVHERRG